MRRECRKRFPPPLRVSDPDMHHGKCVTHVPWCMRGSLTGGFLWSRWWGKRSRHSKFYTECIRSSLFIHVITYLQVCVTGIGAIKILFQYQWIIHEDMVNINDIIPGYEIVGFACVSPCVHDRTCWSYKKVIPATTRNDFADMWLFIRYIFVVLLFPFIFL